MGEKMDAAREFRAENAKKWGVYFDNGGHLTPEIRKQMKDDNDKLAILGREATKEWLEEKKHRKDDA